MITISLSNTESDIAKDATTMQQNKHGRIPVNKQSNKTRKRKRKTQSEILPGVVGGRGPYVTSITVTSDMKASSMLFILACGDTAQREKTRLSKEGKYGVPGPKTELAKGKVLNVKSDGRLIEKRGKNLPSCIRRGGRRGGTRRSS